MAKLNLNFPSRKYFPLFVILLCTSSFFQTISSIHKSKKGGLKLKMIHIDSPNSPTYQPELSNFDRFQRLLTISDYRMHYLTTNSTQQHDVPEYHELNSMTRLYKYEYYSYYVELGLGEFDGGSYHSIFLIVDTGSIVTWTQCEGCRACFTQSSPHFPMNRSRTYRPYMCKECHGRQCDQDHCMYHETYADGTDLKGIWAREKLTFASSIAEELIDEFRFVCGIEITNFIEGENDDNIITGVLGMGRGRWSLLTQLGTRGNYQFSYCLQDSNNLACDMYIRFGDAIQRLPNMFSTPLVYGGIPTHYYVSLIDISVNDKRLNLPKHLFQAKHDKTGGTVFDTGSFFTYLVSEAFDIVIDEISTYVKNYNPSLNKCTDPGVSDTPCWKAIFYTPDVHFPPLIFHFDRYADLFIDPSNVMSKIFQEAHPRGIYYCVNLRRVRPDSSKINIIGSSYQINQLVIFDVGNSLLSFAHVDCNLEV
ncbi:hypothetical protein RND81_04G102400 [Saponaria officinalis]|uniref:Peptidase A1 domain-containing protein n=1 Tax=Saponaria officinalis TaxID=3572 RepID=A0AAW1LMS6_SAPOF